MTNIPLTGSDYLRTVAKAPYIALRNRFVERNPSLSSEPIAVISRPGMRKFTEVGTGPIRKVYSQPGTFNDDLFAISGTQLYRVSSLTGGGTLLGTLSANPLGSISMAATAPIEGSVPAYLFIAEGGVLWCYTEDGSATGHLNVTGTISDNDTVNIGSTYYKWTTGDVNTGTPNGSSGDPWLVAKGSLNVNAMTNLYKAIMAKGEEGVDYSTGLTAHPSVIVTSYSSTDLYIQALSVGSSGNGIALGETSSGLAWDSPSTSGGGNEQLRQIRLPDDLGAISVTVINSYVIVIPVQEYDIKGRFYWIEPGETVIDPLNFATAERSPDELHQVLTFNEMFWLFGTKTTEPWVTTGSADFPMQKFSGILFDRGSWEGAAVNIKDKLLVFDEDGGVFLIQNGQRRLTEGRPDIEEKIRKAILDQSLNT